MKNTYITEHKFATLDLHPLIMKSLENSKYTYCTPIQAVSLPVLLTDKDIAGQAQTGTGKTLAFLLGTFNKLLKNSKPRQPSAPRAIILAPTRELAIQIYNDAKFLMDQTNINAGLVYGGEPYDQQQQSIENGIDILIGTTGRIIDFYKKGVLKLNSIEVVVLDEADRMFDLGFIRDIRFLFRRMPPKENRQNMMFSATLSYKVQELAFEHMTDPVHLEVEPEQKTAAHVTEELFHPSNDEKMCLLQSLIEEEWPDKAIVFANTKQSCENIWCYLAADGHRVGLLTGNIAQKKRIQILTSFTNNELDILVATDVAARGLHIPQVTHVFNYDLPDDCEDYVHRIGRTGRAGESGKSISFACEKYALNLPAIELFIEHTVPISSYNSEALLKDLPAPLKIYRKNNYPKRHNKR